MKNRTQVNILQLELMKWNLAFFVRNANIRIQQFVLQKVLDAHLVQLILKSSNGQIHGRKLDALAIGSDDRAEFRHENRKFAEAARARDVDLSAARGHQGEVGAVVDDDVAVDERHDDRERTSAAVRHSQIEDGFRNLNVAALDAKNVKVFDFQKVFFWFF